VATKKGERERERDDEHVSIFEDRRIDSVGSVEGDDLAPELVNWEKRREMVR